MNPFMAKYAPRIYKFKDNPTQSPALDEQAMKAVEREVMVIAIIPGDTDNDPAAVFIDPENDYRLNSCRLQEICFVNMAHATGITPPWKVTWGALK